MKCLITLLLLVILIPGISSAQKIELINSGDLIKQGAALHDSGQYKKAFVLYNKVSRSDTNYVWSLYEKALTCEADSQYAQAIKYCKEALTLKTQREYEPDIYNTYGNTLNDMGQPEEAIKVFDSAIARYPAYSYLYFNKGIAMVALNRLNDAELLFQKTLLINPYMYSAHYQLGLVAVKQGKIIPSFLSFISYLLVNPEGKYWSKSINFLSQITTSTDEVLGFKNNRKIAPNSNYQEVEDIVLSKIALDKAYKPITALDDPIIRQIQVVFEKLDYKDNDNDFWVQYYLPYFKQVYNQGKFELLINHCFSNSKVAAVQEYNKKNKKELEVFVKDAAAYFNVVRATRELNYNKRDSIKRRYFFEDGKLVEKGELVNNGKTLTGPWEFYYPGGNIKVRGNYNEAGKREGEWQFYFASGRTRAKEQYKNGKLEGKQEHYFENGNLSSVDNYLNDQPEGLVTIYYYAGNKKSITNYKLGKYDGEAKEFYSNGNLQLVNGFVSGARMGLSHEYYKSGQIKEIEQYNNGKAEGPYKHYYESGSLSAEGQNVKDKGQGEWKYYYEDGKIKEKRSYVNDIEEGAHDEYFENGQVSDAYTAKKGKIDGEAIFYYKDGKILSKYMYDNGIIKSAKYFDQSGHELSSAEMKGDGVNVISYSADGVKKACSHYDKKGTVDGADTLFYPSGKLYQVNGYKSGSLNGNSVTYHLNAKKKFEINYTDGKEDGYYTSFYANGQTEVEGWIKDGQYQGEWAYYDEKGNLTSKSYYLDGELDGYKEDYNPNGKKTLEQKYHRGWLEELTQYDTTGNIIAVDSFPKASGKYTLIYPKGQIMTQGNYVNGDFNGPFKTYYFDGSVESSLFYRNGLMDSIYTSYYYGGVKSADGQYKQGNKTGTWKYYNEDGKIYTSAQYSNDLLNGEKTYYFPSGNKDFVSLFKDDQLDGIEKIYDPEGSVTYELAFENDNVKSYSYIGSDGKLVPFVPIASNNGNMKAYFQNGKLLRECTYSDGVKNGANKIYYSNGQIRYIDTAAYGIVEGAFIEYNPNGKLKSEYHYVTDNADGICKEFDSNGLLKKELFFVNGINHGPVKYYDANGKLLKTMWYNYGKLISVKNEK
ncbi:MAG TPA: hypothetical protein VGI43_01850 [Mucilaginibacter sp.]